MVLDGLNEIERREPIILIILSTRNLSKVESR